MGFFTFLSRKSHKEKAGSLFSSQTYQSASVGALPVQGPPSNAGKGLTVRESLTRSRPETGQTRNSLATDGEDPAPAPAVPRFREQFVERPSTAPNGSSPGPSWNNYSNRLRKGTPRGAPPVSFRMFKRTSVAPEPRPGSRGTDKSSSAWPPATPTHEASRSRASSLRSEKGRGFIDVLDAQSEIRPADFRTRVKAAGARDYGEDVADRNLAQNGFNLGASASQPHPSSGQYSSSVPGLSRVSRSEDPLRQLERRPSLYGTGARAQSLTSSTQFPVLSRAGGSQATLRSLDRQDSTKSLEYPSPRGSRRSQSVNTFASAPQTRLGRTPSMDRTVRFFPLENRHDSPRPTTPAEQPVYTPRPLSPRPNTSAPILLTQPWATKQSPIRPSILPRDAGLPARQRVDQISWDHEKDEATYSGSARFKTERSYSLRSSSAYASSGRVASPSVSPRKRHSLHTLQPCASSPVASREGPAVITPSPIIASTREQQSLTRRPTSSKQNKPGGMRSILPSSPVQDVAPKRSIIDQLIPPPPSSVEPFTSPEVSAPIQQTGSGIISSVDTCEGPHANTRSLRASSVSSATATVSDASSNPFQRPHSRHTVNTSVDLSAPSPKAGSRASLHTTPPPALDASIEALPTDVDSSIVSSPESNAFNIDDYVSSDDDSIAGSRHPLGDGEEDLLFNDSGYGAGGMQLPGLFDSLALTPASRQTSQQTLQHHASSPTLSAPWSSGRRMMNYTGDSFGRAAGRRFIIDTGAVDDEEEEYEYDNNRESDACSEAVPTCGGVPEDDAEDEENDEDSLYSRRRSSSNIGDRRRESARSSQPSRAINRLSAIIHPDNRPMTPTSGGKTKTPSSSQIPRPSSAHFRDAPYYKHSVHHSQARYVGDTAVIEELEEQGTAGGDPAEMTTVRDVAQPGMSTTLDVEKSATSETVPARDVGAQESAREDYDTPKDQVVYSAVDVLAAVRLRKEIKARNRAAGAAGPGAAKMAKSNRASRWSIADSLAINTNSYGGYSGPVTGINGNNSLGGNDDQETTNNESDDTMILTKGRNRPLSSGGSNMRYGGGAGRIKVKVKDRVVADRDFEEKGLVQVGVREVGLGLTTTGELEVDDGVREEEQCQKHSSGVQRGRPLMRI